jgi:hypothetical protein
MELFVNLIPPLQAAPLLPTMLSSPHASAAGARQKSDTQQPHTPQRANASGRKLKMRRQFFKYLRKFTETVKACVKKSFFLCGA